MEQTNQPSPYFIRRTAGPENQTIDLREFSIVEDQVHPLRDYWLIAKRHRWLILSCALVSFIGAALYTFTRTPLYTAEATLLIERKAPQFLKVQDARPESIDYADTEFYKTQYEILKSRALAERVIRDQSLENDPLFVGEKTEQTSKWKIIPNLWSSVSGWVAGLTAKPTSTAPDPGAISTGLINTYLSMLEIRPVGGTSLVQIKFTTPDPARSARFANAHAAAYVRYGIDLRSQTNEQASDFLQQKLVELKERVRQSEAALNGYRKEKNIISVDEKSNPTLDRLADLNKSLTAAEAERIAAEAQVSTIRGRNRDELPAVLGSTLVNSLKGELNRLESEWAALSKEFKPGYPALDSLKARMEENRRRLNIEVQNQVNAIEAPYRAAKAKESELRARMEEQKRLTLNLKDSAVQYAILARDVDTNRQLYDGVLQRLKEIGVAAEVRTSNAYIMGSAEPPLWASYPKKQKSLMLGLFMGLAGGIGLAFFLDRLDSTLKSSEEAERYTRLPSLAVVPDFALLNGTHNGGRANYVSRLVSSAKAELPGWVRGPSKNTERQLVLDHHPLSVVTEAYRGLRSSLLLSQAGAAPQTVLITSALRGEGKTTTLINTAIMFAQMDTKVLIIDADLRRPRCRAYLKMDNTVGLTELLAGQIEVQRAIKPTPIDNLSLMSSGTLPPNPAELLGSKKMQEILQQLREQYEFIFIDSSPVMAVSDALLLSTKIDGALLVINGKTPKQLVKKASARLIAVRTKMLGILLNGIDIRNGEFGYYYRHYYDYYPQDPETRNGSTRRRNGKVLSERSDAAAWTTSGDEDSQDFLEIISAKLFDAMGPMATLVLREHILALGESPDAFPKAKQKELIKRVGREILTDSFRLRFEQEMSKEIETLDSHAV
ncbi:MAG TPA: polysaccharide biosynthesis tyrosine autokinase [Candidatus Udaeobacter sp.]|nr:polysaccharide biosynthesis tyrosine autokinase [Candidatus Udaeobacter sp.]